MSKPISASSAAPSREPDRDTDLAPIVPPKRVRKTQAETLKIRHGKFEVELTIRRGG